MITIDFLLGTGNPYPLGRFVQLTIGYYKDAENGSIMGTARQKVCEGLGMIFPDMPLAITSKATSSLEDRRGPRKSQHRRGKSSARRAKDTPADPDPENQFIASKRSDKNVCTHFLSLTQAKGHQALSLASLARACACAHTRTHSLSLSLSHKISLSLTK